MIHHFKSHVLVSAIVIAIMTSPRAFAGPCPPDIDCSGAVNVSDLLTVISNWGASGGASDVDGSGLVDIGDLLNVISAWGPCIFPLTDFADDEAHQIGLEMLGPNGPLSLSQEVYDRIDRDLDIIRAAFPTLVGETHTLAWAPNQMIVNINPSQPTAEYNCYNTFYQLTNSQPLFSTWHVLTFAGKYNVPALVATYMPLAAVTFAEPNGLVGGQNFWSPTDLGGGLWQWNIDDGFHDCFDGCDCHTIWVIEIDARGAIVQSTCNQFGQSWCDFPTPCP
ncbi:MAG: hypothetical protein L0Y44_01240 [Phycisphaerales bacterium]|nr:hypothetical protein [Phycisphaerales bacterium]MCI0629261.1 hypothetical protein [Phycisphaerales bacterium]MCI0674455.1 hypothetical protein [Phycisphaerales bacterium]